MLLFYGGRELLHLLADTNGALPACVNKPPREWTNLGGMIIPKTEVRHIIETIKTQENFSWKKLHQQYAALEKQYFAAKTEHALFTLLNLFGLPAGGLTNISAIK